MKRKISGLFLAAAVFAMTANTVFAATGDTQAVETSAAENAEDGEYEIEKEVTEEQPEAYASANTEEQDVIVQEDSPVQTAEQDDADSAETETEEISEESVRSAGWSSSYVSTTEILEMIDEDCTSVKYTAYYDDTIKLSDMSTTYKDYAIARVGDQNVTSYQVKNGQVTTQQDTAVVTSSGTSALSAVGCGTAEILIVPELQLSTAQSALNGNSSYVASVDWVKVTVTVKAAPLTLILLAGQSNMEGYCSENLGFQQQYSVKCDTDDVYLTYPSTLWSGEILNKGISSSVYCTASNADNYVAESLTSTTSLSGTTLECPLDALGTTGKAGLDGAVAYEWNRLTKDKVWVVNVAVSRASIDSWKSSMLSRALAVLSDVKQVYEAEIAAGHYTAKNKLMFWLHGETDKSMSATDYGTAFLSVTKSLKNSIGFEKIGIITVRASNDTYQLADDICMTGPRSSQYAIGANPSYGDYYIVSNVNEQWVTNSGVASYFSGVYTSGSFTYPMFSTGATLPTKISQVHYDIHYSQLAHNENGITAADTMYRIIKSKMKTSSISWRDGDDKKVTSLQLIAGDVTTLLPVDASYNKLTVTTSNSKVATYNAKTGQVSAKANGTAILTATNAATGKKASVTLTVSGKLDLTANAGASYTGLYYYNGYYWYLEKGIAQLNYTSLVKYNGNWYYVNEGRVDKTYTGIAKRKETGNWYYVKNGKVDLTVTSIEKRPENGNWYYVKNGMVKFSYTGLAKRTENNTWWYIKAGKVNFSYTNLVKYNSNWYYVKNGQVQSSYTGIVKRVENSNWYYVKNGKVDFTFTGVALRSENNSYYYIKAGRVDFTATGIAVSGDEAYYVKNGKVVFTASGVAPVIGNAKLLYYVAEGQWNPSYTGEAASLTEDDVFYYVKQGIVDLEYTGYFQRSDGSWGYVENGIVVN